MRDIVDPLDRIAHLLVDPCQGILRLMDERHTGIDLLRPGAHPIDGLLRIGLDQSEHLRNLLGGLPGTLGELAHFVGDHGEPTSLFACSRCLDRRIERQQIGLVGDLLDDAGDLADFRRALSKRFDLLGRLLDRLGKRDDRRARFARPVGPFARNLTGLHDHALCRLRMLGNLADRYRHLFNRGGRRRCRLALPLCRIEDDAHARIDAMRRLLDLLGRIGKSLHGGLHRGDEYVHLLLNAAQGIGTTGYHAPLQIAGGQHAFGPIAKRRDITRERRNEPEQEIERVEHHQAHQHPIGDIEADAGKSLKHVHPPVRQRQQGKDRHLPAERSQHPQPAGLITNGSTMPHLQTDFSSIDAPIRRVGFGNLVA